MYQAICRLLEMEKEQIMATKGIHRSTSTSKAGRQIASATAPIYNAEPTYEAEQVGKYICPVRTVADLVNNLLSWKSKAQYDAAIDAAIAKEQS